jgi:hypothetical protein
MRELWDAPRKIGDGERAENCLPEMREREAGDSDFGV